MATYMKPAFLLSTCFLVGLGGWQFAFGQGLEKDRAETAKNVATRNAGVLVKAEPSADEVGKRYALVIGNADYKNTTPLANPVNDGRAVCKMLRSLQFEVDCYENLQKRGSFKEAISDFTKKLKPSDVALFYYAGHGLELGGENFLVPTDADIRSKAYVEDDAVRVNFIFDELGAAKARLSIVILDACRNNPFARVRSVSGTGLAMPNSIPSGSIIIFPTSPGKVALDGSGQNGVFTSHLLKHLPTTGITIEEMFKRVSSGVRDDSIAAGIEQTPWLNLSFSGEFCFVGCGTRINPEDYANVLKAKAEIEKTTQTLQAELAYREDELGKFKTRMAAMQQQFEGQQKSQNLSKTELETLSKQRDELIAKTAYLDSQQRELSRVKVELQSLQAQQVEHTKREGEMAAARERIASLEKQITHQGARSFGESELATLRRDRDALISSNQALQDRQKASEAKQREMADQQQKRLQDYDKQRGELDDYKVKLSRLEVENREKDESVRQMRLELESRQVALTDMKDRVQLLQRQMEDQRVGKNIAAEDQMRLQSERAELTRKAQELQARERDLTEARAALSQAEKQGNDQKAKQELIALQQRLGEYDKQKSELDSYKLQMARMEATQFAIQVELKQERERRQVTEEKYKDAAKSAVKDAAFVPPVF